MVYVDTIYHLRSSTSESTALSQSLLFVVSKFKAIIIVIIVKAVTRRFMNRLPLIRLDADGLKITNDVTNTRQRKYTSAPRERRLIILFWLIADQHVLRRCQGFSRAGLHDCRWKKRGRKERCGGSQYWAGEDIDISTNAQQIVDDASTRSSANKQQQK